MTNTIYQEQIQSILNTSGSPDGNKIKKLNKLYPDLYNKILEYNQRFNIETKESLYLLYHNLTKPYLLFYSFKDGYEYNIFESDLIKDIPMYIETIFLTKSKGLNPNRLRLMQKSIQGTNTYFQDNFPLLYNLYTEKYPLLTIPEFMYLVYNNLNTKPTCIVCDSETDFMNFKVGYQKHCSLKCSQSNPDTKQKQKETQQSKFGGYAFSTPEGVEKVKQTNLERYGDTSFARTQSYKDKSKLTSQLNWGVDNPMQNPDVKEKVKQTQFDLYGHYGFVANPNTEQARQTNLERYGTEFYIQSDYGKQAYRKTLFSNYKNRLIPFLQTKGLIWNQSQEYEGWFTLDENKIYKCYCTKCNQDILIDIRCRCLNCYPINSNISMLEKEILEFIQQNYTKTIITNSKTILDTKQELDIYLPDLNLAFEVNGTYWHSSIHKQRLYHQEKTDQALKQGISLIHIWEQSYNSNPELIKAMILNKLKMIKNKIHARKCSLKISSQSEVIFFLDHNHIHKNGRPKPSNISLVYDNEIVSVLTYYIESDTIWIDRYATKTNYKVNGGFSKLISKLPKGMKIKSYISRDWSPDYENTSYNKLGFEKVKTTSPTLYYSDRLHNKHWFLYQKHKLKSNPFYDDNKTSEEIMLANGFYTTYDSGNFLAELSRDRI